MARAVTLGLAPRSPMATLMDAILQLHPEWAAAMLNASQVPHEFRRWGFGWGGEGTVMVRDRTRAMVRGRVKP